MNFNHLQHPQSMLVQPLVGPYPRGQYPNLAHSDRGGSFVRIDDIQGMG